MAEKGKRLAWYGRTEEWLLRNGARYHFSQKLGPMGFLLLRILLAIAGFLVFFLLAPSYGILAGAALFFLPSGLVLYMNGKDNLRMLPDLKHMYHSLEIQTRAGVFVTDAMAELYGSVKERRLKQALLELAGDLVMRSDLGDALERFQKKFDNRYVDSLCMIILQAMESGQSVDLLSDLSEQIKDMEASVLSQKKEALDRSVTFYQLGILVAVMGVVLYACVTQMFAAATGF
jgi:Flp pilus assembly protein TadB